MASASSSVTKPADAKDPKQAAKDKWTALALCTAASTGDIEALDKLAAEGADFNLGDYDGRTALHLAAADGREEVIKYLIEHGASLDVHDRWDHTPLNDALRQGHENIVQILIDLGAGVKKANLATYLCAAASAGHVSELKLLLNAGTDVNACDYDGRTALHLASSEGRLEAVEYLLSRGANFRAVDRWRHTAFQDAIRNGHDNVAKLLTAKGAQITSDDYSVESAYDWEIDVSEIDFVEKIGQGAFAEVFKGVWRGNRVAVKKYKAQEISPTSLLEFRREVAMLSKIRHPNVVLFMAASTKPPNLCIACEYLGGGSIFDLLHGKEPHKPEFKRLLRVALDVAVGMNHLHQSHFIHRDLKTANIVMDDHGTCKIVDFGLSRIEEETGNMTGETGSYRWAAPEVLRNERYSEKVDVYSFGIVLWEMLTAEIPYSQYSPIQAAVAVAERDVRPEIPATCPPQLAELISQCWDNNPSLRPSFGEIVERLRGFMADAIEMEKQPLVKEKSWIQRKLDALRKPSQPAS